MPGAAPAAADGSPGILHVDMDAFFAAVEVLDDPSLRGVPLVVGGDGARGVVASCSYEARRYGVRSAMPSLRARRLCPQAVFRPGRYERYVELSGRIHEVFDHFTPLVEGIALDEAFLDVSGAARLLGPSPAVAAAVRTAIRSEVGLECSVGVAATKFVAKLASEAAKPTADRPGVHPGLGVVVVGIGEELDFLRPLPVESLWGVGPATAARLRGIGVTTVGQLGATPPEMLERTVGRGAGRHLHRLAWGLDDRRVEPYRAAKSIGHEETYPQDRHDRTSLQRELVRMGDAVGARLRAAGVAGRTVQLKVRFSDFRTITRARTLPEPVSTGPAIERLASVLLDGVDVGTGVRLLGVSVSSLVPAGPPPAEQLVLGLASGLDATTAGPAIAGRLDASALHAVGPAPDGPIATRPAPASPRPVPAGADGATRRAPTVGLGEWDAATVAIDAIRARYGDRAVGSAALLGADGVRFARSDPNRWGPVGNGKSEGPAVGVPAGAGSERTAGRDPSPATDDPPA